MRKHLVRPYSLNALFGGLIVLLSGCSSAGGADSVGTSSQAYSGGGGGGYDGGGGGSSVLEGDLLFHLDTFGGNGRTCSTCHTDNNFFTLSPEEAKAIYSFDPHAPLFRSIDSDDGVGNSYTRLLTHATIRITIPLPSNIKLAPDASATSATFARGIPTTQNTPALDPILMADGRDPNLEAQAAGAILAHFQPKVTPSTSELNAIAAYEDTLFSSLALAKYAENPTKYPLTLPTATTPSEKRGEAFVIGSAPNGICQTCHSSPLLDIDTITGVPNFDFIYAGEFPTDNQLNPLQNYIIDMTGDVGTVCDPGLCPILAGPGGGGVCVTSPAAGCEVAYRDPGRALISGSAFAIGGFKIPILRNIKNTAPYFHDNSASTLQEVVQHYVTFFQSPFNLIAIAPAPGGYNAPSTPQDVDDIVAYLNLL